MWGGEERMGGYTGHGAGGSGPFASWTRYVADAGMPWVKRLLVSQGCTMERGCGSSAHGNG